MAELTPYDIIQITKNTRIKQRVRSGTDLERKQIQFSLGELAWTTDSKRLYVGDGSKLGGNPVTNRFRGEISTWQTTLNYDVGDFFKYIGTEAGIDKGLYQVESDALTNGGKTQTLIVGYMSSEMEMINKIYPVGSIYLSVGETTPETLFGGSWSRISSGYFLKTQDSTLGSFGGQETVTLTADNYQNHKHTIPTTTIDTSGGSITADVGQFKATFNTYLVNIPWSDSRQAYVINPTSPPAPTTLSSNEISYGHSHTFTIPELSTSGGTLPNQPITIDPPHILIAMWVRTA